MALLGLVARSALDNLVNMHPRTNILVALVAMVTAGSMFAGDSKVLVIKGKVIGDEGKPTDGTEVRVKALDRQGPDKVVETNSQGQYIVVGLVPGDYSVTAYDSFGNASAATRSSITIAFVSGRFSAAPKTRPAIKRVLSVSK